MHQRLAGFKYYDAFNPAANACIGNTEIRSFFGCLDGWWIDSTEPDILMLLQRIDRLRNEKSRTELPGIVGAVYECISLVMTGHIYKYCGQKPPIRGPIFSLVRPMQDSNAMPYYLVG
jgi:hypothetical protein